jgi:peptide/nickel transport system substrate-binding protein
VIIPAGGGRWISMNMSQKPFDNLNLRKAVLAGFDRKALLLARGGTTIGQMPTHYLPPGIAGYEDAGGAKGPGFDFMNATGAPNRQLSAEYFKKAGYPSGKYTGGGELLMVGTNEGVAQKVAEIAKQNFEQMGFKVRLRLVTQDSMYTKFCNTPSAKVDVCPNVGWLKDFADGQTILDPTFNGENILPEGNSNWSMLDDKKINAVMDKAKLLTTPEARAKAWAEADKLITAQAPAIEYTWDKDPLIESPNVNGVADEQNAQWAIAWTSLK